MEQLINRIRLMLRFNLPLAQIRAQITDASEEDIFLAYHAAKRLEGM